jgi:hypothetical protein
MREVSLISQILRSYSQPTQLEVSAWLMMSLTALISGPSKVSPGGLLTEASKAGRAQSSLNRLTNSPKMRGSSSKTLKMNLGGVGPSRECSPRSTFSTINSSLRKSDP